MKSVKIKSINKVIVGKSSQKGTPYIKLLCKTEDGENCSWTGWKTEKAAAMLRDNLAVFKFNGSIQEVVEAADEDKVSFFKSPTIPALVETEVYTNREGEQVEQLVIKGFEGVGYTPKYSREEVIASWKGFDNVTKAKKNEEVPF